MLRWIHVQPYVMQYININSIQRLVWGVDFIFKTNFLHVRQTFTFQHNC